MGCADYKVVGFFFFLLFTFTEKSHKNHIMLSHIEIDFLVRKWKDYDSTDHKTKVKGD